MSVSGVCKWFDEKKGFGFITGQDGTEVFVHYSAIKADGYKKLAEGEEVAYDVEKSDKGMRAANVTRLNPATV